jgi:hypothetical protein
MNAAGVVHQEFRGGAPPGSASRRRILVLFTLGWNRIRRRRRLAFLLTAQEVWDSLRLKPFLTIPSSEKFCRQVRGPDGATCDHK